MQFLFPDIDDTDIFGVLYQLLHFFSRRFNRTGFLYDKCGGVFDYIFLIF